MQIVPVTPQTALICSQIHAYGWKSGYRGIVPQDYLDHIAEDRWVPRLLHSAFHDLLLEDGGNYVATVTYGPARDEQLPGWGEMISMYVHPSYLRRGYGRVLFRHAVDALHAAGFSRIYLWVLEENANARAFYAAQGFAPNGDRAMLEIGGKELVELRYVSPPPHKDR